MVFFRKSPEDEGAAPPHERFEPTLPGGPFRVPTPAPAPTHEPTAIQPGAVSAQESADEQQPVDDQAPRERIPLLPRLGLAAIGLALVWVVGMLFFYTIKFPDPLAVQANKTPTIRILARDGSLLAERGSKHPYIPIDLLPSHVLDAVVAIEDRRFYEHYGVDASGLVRAAFANLRAGRYAQGGSTLTQQLAKNLYLHPSARFCASSRN